MSAAFSISTVVTAQIVEATLDRHQGKLDLGEVDGASAVARDIQIMLTARSLGWVGNVSVFGRPSLPTKVVVRASVPPDLSADDFTDILAEAVKDNA